MLKKNNIIFFVIIFVLFKIIVDYRGVYLDFISVLKQTLSLLACFIIGVLIAYILSPVLKYTEKTFKIKKGKAIVIIYTLLMVILFTLVLTFVPVITKSVEEIGNKMPEYVNSINIHLFNAEKHLKVYNIELKNIEEYVNTLLKEFLNVINFAKIQNIITISISGVLTWIFGFIISIYVLYYKEQIEISVNKILYAILSEKAVRKTTHILGLIDEVFLKFILGKIIDCAIVFLMLLISFMAFRIPLAPFLSFLIATTNLVPFVGPYIGGGFSILIVLFYSPLKTLIVLISVIAIQQIDAWIIEPRILGTQIKLNPILIIAGVIIGGEIFGIIGMFLGVPFIALVKILFYDEYVLNKIKSKHLNKFS